MSKQSVAGKHTPGPWMVRKGHNCTIVAENTPETIAFTRWGPGVDEDANARLIAAAPDLLEAAIAMRSISRKTTRAECDRACDMLAAAIAKATGGVS